jgi:hypothetical protein
MSPDPNAQAYVLATAFLTSFFFAMGAWVPALLLLRWLLL